MTVDLTARLSEQTLRAKAELKKRGLKLPGRPTFDMPRLKVGVDRLPDLDDKELMDLLVTFTRWQDYVAGQHVMAEIDEQVLADALDVAKMRHLSANWSGTSDARVRISTANATIDPHVRDLSNQFLDAKARRKALGVLMEILDRDARVVSREITLRDSRRPTERRAARFEA